MYARFSPEIEMQVETVDTVKMRHESLRGIVIFDSKFGNTEKVAKSLAGGLVRAGIETICTNTRDVKRESLMGFDLIAVGAPTQMFTASKPMKNFLLELEGVQGLKGKLGFAFDTKFGSPLAGSAAKYIEKRLEQLGLSIVKPRQSAIVGKTEGPLEEGEMEVFEKIGYEIGRTMGKVEKTVPSPTPRQ
jgi:flavodoxin I